LGPNLSLPNSFSSDIWECNRDGTCCRLFVFTGVTVSEREWNLLEPEIKSLGLSADIFKICKDQKTLPVIGEKPPKKCAFLKDDNICLIYLKRPSRCREYPIMIQQRKDTVILHVSTDCPRGKDIAKTIKPNPPDWIKRYTDKKKIKVVSGSFYENSIYRYNDEEL